MAGWRWLSPTDKAQQEHGFFQNMLDVLRQNGAIPPDPVTAPQGPIGNAPELPPPAPGYTGNDPMGYGTPNAMPHPELGPAAFQNNPAPAPPKPAEDQPWWQSILDKTGTVLDTARHIATFQAPSYDENTPPDQTVLGEFLGQGSGEQALRRGIYTGGRSVDSSNLPDAPYLPLRQAVDIAASPLTIATLGMGGEAVGPLAAAKVLGSGTAGYVAQQQIEKNLPEWVPEPVAQTLGLGAAVGAGLLTHKVLGGPGASSAGERWLADQAAPPSTSGADLLNQAKEAPEAAVLEMPAIGGGALPTGQQGTVNRVLGGDITKPPEPLPGLPTDLSNLTPSTPGLSLPQRAANAYARLRGNPEPYHPTVTPMMGDLRANIDELRTQGTAVAMQARSTWNLFKKGVGGRVILLDGTQAFLPDLAERIAADPSLATTLLTDVQAKALASDVAEYAKWRNTAAAVGIPIGDIEGYLPRGGAELEDQVQRLKNSGGPSGGGKATVEKSRTQPTMEESVGKGNVYQPYPQAVADTLSHFADRIAKQHTANLLEPMGTTAAERIPAAVRAEYQDATNLVQRLAGRLDTAEGRAGTANSTADELAANLERQATGATLPVDPSQLRSNINTVNRFISRAQQRIVELRQRGGAYATDADSYQAMLDDAKVRLDAASGDWKDAVGKAQATPRGQSQIPGLPLWGRAFPNDIANAVSTSLNGDTPLTASLPGVKPVLQGLNAVGGAFNSARTLLDFVTPMRLMAAGVQHPQEWAQAWGPAIKSIFSGDHALGDVIAEHNRLAAIDPMHTPVGTMIRDYGLELTSNTKGVSGVRSLPFLRQGNRFIGTYMDSLRIKALDNSIDLYGKAGLVNTPGDKLALGHIINTVTGEGPTAFGGAGQGLVNFPKWLGSQVELITKASADGTIQGAYAREALMKTLGLGMALTYGVNAAQGKETKWVDGVPVMWLGDTKIQPFGPWGTLIKMTVKSSPVALDSEHNFQTPDIAYDVRAKGSPPLQIATDLIQGSSYSGEKPGTLPWLARSLAPYTLANTGKESLATQGLNAVGLRATDMTPNQELDQLAQDNGFKNWDQASPDFQAQAKLAHPDMWQAKLDVASQQAKDYQSAKDYLTKGQVTADQMARGLIPGQSLTKKQWRDKYDQERYQLQGVALQLYGAGNKHVDNPTRWQDMWGNAVVDNTKNGQTDYLAEEDAIAKLPQSAQDNINQARSIGNTPMVAQYKQAGQERSYMFNNIPKYQGLSPKDTGQVDRAITDVKNLTGPKAPVSEQLRALGEVARKIGLTPTQGNAAQAAIFGTLKRMPAIYRLKTGKMGDARQAYAEAHPLVGEFYGPGDFQ